MSGLAWKLNRLRAMGAPEVLFRAGQALQARVEEAGLGLAKPPCANGSSGRPWVQVIPTGFDPESYRDSADRVLAGRFDVFALKDAAIGFPPKWNRDPKTGTEAPLTFGKTLNYRDERLVGDIKYLWEPNRHAELLTLAQAWHLTGEVRYAEGSQALLESWFEQCPYPIGPNWTSSLEHAVRLVNWAIAWFLLGEDRLEPELKGRWLDSVYQHCHFIAGHFSRHSSANNHLLGELMGLFVASATWPLWPESARWRERAKQEFESEALKQTAEDGVNREQATWYHHEVADMMLLVGLFGRANGIEFSKRYWDRLERMLEFIAALMDAGGNVPMIGDADDAVMVRFAPVDAYRSLLATGAVLFSRSDFKAKAGCFDDKSRWLLGDAPRLTFESLPENAPNEPRRGFPQGGYSILGDQFGGPNEIRMVADAGPLGYLSIAAHGHADALAFTLSVGGNEVLIDPGTYAYHTQRKWRDYFKGTSAHNTVRIDGVDQSVSGGNFLWTRHARATRERFESTPQKDFWIASHDGYLRLKDPVLHRRAIELDKTLRTIRITDRLECKKSHRVELFWHLAETCQAQREGSLVTILAGRAKVNVVMTGSNWSPEIISGQEDPSLGWISRRFDEKVPCSTLVWAGEANGTMEVVTLMTVE